MKISRIVITRRLSDDGHLLDQVKAVDTNDDELPLTEALGMLRLAEDTLIRERMGEVDG